MNLCSVQGCKNIARGQTIYCNRHAIQIRRYGKVIDPTFESLPGEIFKDISGYRGDYKVSNKGRIISMKRDIPVVLKPQKCKRKAGVYVTLCNNETKKVSLAEIVTTHFLAAPCFEGDRLIYIDGDDTNCCADNLAYESMFLLPKSLALLSVEAVDNDDAASVIKFISGDTDAIATILKKYKSELTRAINYNLAMRGITSNIISSDDIAQEAYMKALQCIKMGKLTTATKIKSWLISVAKNIIRANASAYYKIMEETCGYHSDYNTLDLCVEY